MTGSASTGVSATGRFTYKDVPSESLEQGDVLVRTSPLNKVLREIFPYFSDASKYPHFMVLTQTCDLVRRGKGTCKAEYITLAPVRPIAEVLDRELASIQGPGELERRAGVCGIGRKFKLKQFVESLLDNNRPHYFYLHPDAAVGLSEPSCAFLQVSLTLKAEHYQTCLDARRLSIKDVFQAKLGSHLGSLYSRVGTPEWVGDGGLSDKEFKAMVNEHVIAACTWVDDEKLKIAKSQVSSSEISELPAEELRRRVADAVVPSTRGARVVVRVEALLEDLGLIDGEETLQKVRSRLENDASLRKLLE
jgi:hypothetical protein